jgi:NADPH2:quinone reductase
MRAVLVEAFGSPDQVVVRQVPEPTAGPDEVVVDVHSAGVNFPDLLVIGGTYQILPDLPFSPGKEIAGVVSEVGARVQDLALGDRVVAQIEHGGYAERVAVTGRQAVRVPDGVALDVAASFGLAHVTAHYALRHRARFVPGETVLVTGATGAVGMASIRLAKAWGATVIAAAADPRGVAAVLEAGADHAVAADPATLRDEVREHTAGRGVDVALELVGGELFTQTVRCLAWEGRLVVLGFASGDIASVRSSHVLVKNISVTGLQVSDYRDRDPEGFGRVLAELLELHRSGVLKVPIAARFPLADAREALTKLAARQIKGNIVLNP